MANTIGNPKKGFVDTKQFRLDVLEKANQRLGIIIKTLSEGNGTQVNKQEGMLSLLDSTYKADVPSTIYALHLKTIAFEAARFLATTEEVKDDLIFVTTRGEYFSQNIASFLFPNNVFSQTDSTDQKVRNFYLSIIEAYFGGSTKTNIESSLLKFLEVPVGITENFLLSRQNPSSDEIVKKFTFDIIVNVDDPRIKDITKLQDDIKFLVNIIKPAHTTFETKFIFQEFFDIFRKGCLLVKDASGNPFITHDGFETKLKLANTAICDTFHIDSYDYYYEDLRKKIENKSAIYIENETLQNEEDIPDPLDPNIFHHIIQASPRLVKNVDFGGLWNVTDPSIFHTKYGPLGTRLGYLAISTTDITVYVNGIPVEVEEIYPLSGAVKLVITPSDSDIVTASYYYLKRYIGALITNDFDSVLNNIGRATEFSYKTVLYPTNYIPESNETPLITDYKYEGFDLFNTSILNDPFTLSLNELGVRNRLNDYNVFKSFGYDSNVYSTSLGETTTPVPVSLDKKDVWRRLPYQEIRLNNTEFIMNNPEDRLYGEIHLDSYHPFYSALALTTKNNGGTTGIVSSIFEDEKNPMFIEFRRLFEEEAHKLGKDYDSQFYTYPSASGYWDNSIWVDPKFTVLNDENCVISGGNASWEFSASGDATYSFGGNNGQMHILINDREEETYPHLTIKDEIYSDGITNIIPNINFSQQKLWDRDPNENPWYRQSHLVNGNRSTFLEEIIYAGIDLNFITPRKILVRYTEDVSSVFRVTNTRGILIRDYDLTDMSIVSDNIITLDVTKPTNIIIGYQAGDIIHSEYTTSENIDNEVTLELPHIYPIHIDDLKQEFYKENILCLNINPINYFTNSNVDISNNLIEIQNHGLLEGQLISFSSTGTLPIPLQEVITYFTKNVTSNTFQVSLIKNGSEIDLLTTGDYQTKKVYKSLDPILNVSPVIFFTDINVDIINNTITTNTKHLLIENQPIYFYTKGILPAPLGEREYTFLPSSVNIITDTITINSHGLINDQEINFGNLLLNPGLNRNYTSCCNDLQKWYENSKAEYEFENGRDEKGRFKCKKYKKLIRFID